MGHQKEDDVAELFNGHCRRDSDSAAIVPSEKYTEKGDQKEVMEEEMEHGGEEGYDPLEYLPEEIWEIIFGFLKDSPKTLINCCKVSDTWADILTLKKSTWLFQEILPFVFGYLKNKDILKCRKVCKTWRNSVDKFVEDHPCHHPSAPDGFDDGDIRRESVYYPLIAKKLHQIRFNDSEELIKFRLEMEHTSRNPIIGRSVCFYCRPQEEWMMNALHFLSEFGRHIWYFSFESFHAPLPFLQWLRQCLVLLPNLKKLRIYASPAGFMNEDDGNPDQNPLDAVTEELRANPLPPLPSLETLELFTKCLPNIMQDTILSTYAQNVHRLEVDEWDEIYITEENYPLSQLKELSLKIDSNDTLENLTQLHCPHLRKLTLCIRHREIDLQILCRTLQHFRENLRVLKISLTTMASFKMEKFLDAFSDFTLPSLKVLVLVNAEDLPYNFLNGVQSIEYFHYEKWRRTEDASMNHLSFVQIRGFVPFATKRDSEIWVWDTLPSLKRLTFLDLMLDQRKKIFTREMDRF